MKKSVKKSTRVKCYECRKPTIDFYDGELCRTCFVECILGRTEARRLAKEGKFK